ncbi:MAG: ABC transporter permease [Candidatus Hodarchaeales archaeon]
MNMSIRILIRSFKQVIRSPARMVLIIGFPIFFILIFAFIFGGGAMNEETVSVGIVNLDKSQTLISVWREDFSNYTSIWGDNESTDPFSTGFGEFFIQSLKGQTNLEISNSSFRIVEFSSTKEALVSVQSRVVSVGIVIPSEFSLAVLSGINAREILFTGQPIVGNPLILNQNLTIDILGDPSFLAFQTGFTEVENALDSFKSQIYGIDVPAGNFITTFENVVSYELTQFDYFISGFFTFGLILTSSGIAGIIGEEREYRTLERVKLSRVKPVEYLLGISLNQVALATVQVGIMFIAAYLFGFRGQGNPIFAALVAILTLLPILGLAVFVSAFVPNGRDANGVIAMLSAPIGFVSGAFLPVPEIPLIANIVPDGSGSLRALQLWDFFPFHASTKAIRNILLFDHTFAQILPDLIFLIIGGMLFFVFGMIFFVRRIFTPEN